MSLSSTIGSREVFCTAEPARREKGLPLLSSPRYRASVTRMRSRATSTLFLSRTKLTSLRCVKGAMARKAVSTPIAMGRIRFNGRISRSWLLPDRQSVVEGKSVSVRVDLGGGRFIQKKKKNKYQRTQ